ncbi:MAG: hypothetical protein WD768_07840 [Phycisphaeraceae bacterium]
MADTFRIIVDDRCKRLADPDIVAIRVTVLPATATTGRGFVR